MIWVRIPAHLEQMWNPCLYLFTGAIWDHPSMMCVIESALRCRPSEYVGEHSYSFSLSQLLSTKICRFLTTAIQELQEARESSDKTQLHKCQADFITAVPAVISLHMTIYKLAYNLFQPASHGDKRSSTSANVEETRVRNICLGDDQNDLLIKSFHEISSRCLDVRLGFWEQQQELHPYAHDLSARDDLIRQEMSCWEAEISDELDGHSFNCPASINPQKSKSEIGSSRVNNHNIRMAEECGVLCSGQATSSDSVGARKATDLKEEDMLNQVDKQGIIAQRKFMQAWLRLQLVVTRTFLTISRAQAQAKAQCKGPTSQQDMYPASANPVHYAHAQQCDSTTIPELHARCSHQASVAPAIRNAAGIYPWQERQENVITHPAPLTNSHLITPTVAHATHKLCGGISVYALSSCHLLSGVLSMHIEAADRATLNASAVTRGSGLMSRLTPTPLGNNQAAVNTTTTPPSTAKWEGAAEADRFTKATSSKNNSALTHGSVDDGLFLAPTDPILVGKPSGHCKASTSLPLILNRDPLMDAVMNACKLDVSLHAGAICAHSKWELFGFTHVYGLLLPGCSYFDCSSLTGSSDRQLPTQLCSKCRRACYCSKTCQKAAWIKGHNKICHVISGWAQTSAL